MMHDQFFTLKMFTEYNSLIFELKVQPSHQERKKIFQYLRKEFGQISVEYHSERNEISIQNPPTLTLVQLNNIADRIVQVLTPRHAGK
jgi:hypothetical protein